MSGLGSVWVILVVSLYILLVYNQPNIHPSRDLFMTLHDLIWHYMTFSDLPYPFLNFYDLFWFVKPSMMKCLLPSPGLKVWTSLTWAQINSELQGLTQSTPSLVVRFHWQDVYHNMVCVCNGQCLLPHWWRLDPPSHSTHKPSLCCIDSCFQWRD